MILTERSLRDPLTREELPALPLINQHTHFEGTFKLLHLHEVAAELGIDLPNLLWEEVDKQLGINPKDKSLPNFIAGLPTPAMRLILIAGIEQSIDAKTILKTFFRKAFDIYRELGYNFVDMFVSPPALTIEGNLAKSRIAYLLENEPHKLAGANTQEGKAIYERWSDIDPSHIPTIKQFFEALNEVIAENSQIERAPKKNTSLSPHNLYIGIRFDVRRDADIGFHNKSWEEKGGQLTPSRLVTQAIAAYKRGDVDAIDVAGIEGLVPLKNLSFFLLELQRKQIPFTVHAGELTPEKASQAYENLFWAIMLGAKRIGHAVRIFDPTPLANLLLAEVIKRGITLEVNLDSNRWTDVVDDDLSQHPFIITLKSSINQPDSVVYDIWGNPIPLKHLKYVICDDDIAITNPVTEELLEFQTLLPENSATISAVLAMAYEAIWDIPREDVSSTKYTHTQLIDGLNYHQMHQIISSQFRDFQARAQYNQHYKKPAKLLSDVWQLPSFGQKDKVEQERIRFLRPKQIDT